jgi:hypothetical protein
VSRDCGKENGVGTDLGISILPETVPYPNSSSRHSIAHWLVFY